MTICHYTAKARFVEMFVFSIIVSTEKKKKYNNHLSAEFLSGVSSGKDAKDLCENHGF